MCFLIGCSYWWFVVMFRIDVSYRFLVFVLICTSYWFLAFVRMCVRIECLYLLCVFHIDFYYWFFVFVSHVLFVLVFLNVFRSCSYWFVVLIFSCILYIISIILIIIIIILLRFALCFLIISLSMFRSIFRIDC